MDVPRGRGSGCRARVLGYVQTVPDPTDDPHDPLAPRPDDPRVAGWCCWRGRRTAGGARPGFFGLPLSLVLMVLVVGFVALGVVLLVRAGTGG